MQTPNGACNAIIIGLPYWAPSFGAFSFLVLKGIMKKIEIKTNCKKVLSDIYTPVGIYLRLRDRFRDTILLESTDYHVAENSTSFICINAIAGIEISNTKTIEFKLPGVGPDRAAENLRQG